MESKLMRIRISPDRPLCILVLVTTIMLQACSDSARESNTEASGTSEPQSKPGLVLFPSNEPSAGATVLVEGEDFRGDCSVQIVFDGSDTEPLVMASIDEEGIFSVQTVIPADAPTGKHQLTAQGLTGPNCDQFSDNADTLDINVKSPLPLLLIDTIEARPGGSVQIAGRGFCNDVACSPVIVLVDGAIVAQDIEVDADGSFNVTAQVPAVDNAGEIMVVAVQTDAAGETLRGFGDLIVTVRPGGKRPVIL
jgi:hypothetical protein